MMAVDGYGCPDPKGRAKGEGWLDRNPLNEQEVVERPC